jgi:hypothetical protein
MEGRKLQLRLSSWRQVHTSADIAPISTQTSTPFFCMEVGRFAISIVDKNKKAAPHQTNHPR